MRRWHHATSALIHVLIVSTICIYQAKQPQEAGTPIKKLSIKTQYISIEKNNGGYKTNNIAKEKSKSKINEKKYVTSYKDANISIPNTKNAIEKPNLKKPIKQITENKVISRNTGSQEVASSSSQGEMAKPVCKKCIKPKYPRSALRKKLEGATRISLEISKEGRVTNATIVKSSGVASIDKAALKAANSSIFFPQDIPGKISIEYILKMPKKNR